MAYGLGSQGEGVELVVGNRRKEFLGSQVVVVVERSGRLGSLEEEEEAENGS